MKSILLTLSAAAVLLPAAAPQAHAGALPKISLSSDGHGFQTSDGHPFVPLGVTYFRPGTGWAPQVWKQYDADATRADFARLKELGVTCVRVFISYGSFFMQPDRLSPDGLAKFDQFLATAEAAGIYVHPTGPDHWEGTPSWARSDPMADEQVLSALENFWTLFAARYRDRHVIFAYDLKNEPEIAWNTPALRQKWNRWLERKYGSSERIAQAWGSTNASFESGQVPVPERNDAPGNHQLLDYQLFRESVADDWTRRQAAAMKAADPHALVTVGLIQWSVPTLLPGIAHYAAFRPQRQAPYLDFMEIHFYPLEHGFYEYRDNDDEARNLAYLESVVREVAAAGKPVVVAEFGWQGGGKLTIDGGKHPPATEEQQARWCGGVIDTTSTMAVGWLNWGFYDHPQAQDVSQLTGLLTVDGRIKAWGQEFMKRATRLTTSRASPAALGPRPRLDWDRCLTSSAAANEFRKQYLDAFRRDHP